MSDNNDQTGGEAAAPKKEEAKQKGGELPKNEPGRPYDENEPGKPHIGEVILGIPNDFIDEVAKATFCVLDASRSIGEKYGYKRGLWSGITWGILASGLIDLVAVAAIIHFTK